MPWYADWFGLDYLQLYAHRNSSEAEKQISFIESVLSKQALWNAGPILDIACGAGRHCEQLISKAPIIAGLDLSSELLGEADKLLDKSPKKPLLVQADMRQVPFADNSFALLLSMFTSFGYFDQDSQHEATLDEWHRVLKPEGVLVLDYLNRERIIQALPHETSEKKPDGRILKQRRYLSKDQTRVVKEIKIIHPEPHQEPSSYLESVRMYSEKEIREMFNSLDFTIIECFGNFNGQAFEPNSERLIIFAQAIP